MLVLLTPMFGLLTFRFLVNAFTEADVVSYAFADDYDSSISEAIKFTKYVIYNQDIPEPVDFLLI